MDNEKERPMDDDSHDRIGSEPPGELIRPFLMTGGRTRSSIDDLQFETMVERTGADGQALRFEAARVHELAGRTIAIAEISATLDVPIGAIKVLVGDLVGSGHLRLHRTTGPAETGHVELLNRLITGLKRLWQ